MRLPTFSVVRVVHSCCRQWRARPCGASGGGVAGARRMSSSRDAPAPQADPPSPKDEGTLLEFAESWPPTVESELRARMVRDMRVLPAFVSEHEEAALMAELDGALRRMRYEYDHWDDAIHGYKETERGEWEPHNAAVMARVREAAFGGAAGSGDNGDEGPGEPLTRCHVLDLAPAGHIKPHIDAVRYCGAVIAGLCLLSDAVMRLQHAQKPQLVLDALLPRRALYVMSGAARYSFTHAVLGGADSTWRGQRVLKRRRVAVITRSAPPPPPEDTRPVFYTSTRASATDNDCAS